MKSSILALAAALAVAGCASDTPTAASPAAAHRHGPALSVQESGLDASIRNELAALRNATATFHDITKAAAAGYTTPVTGCMSNPGVGGMGFHYADLSRFDAVVEPMRPEILVYAPKPNGELQLVAVEYAVPLAAWTAPEPPSAFGQSFHVNTTFGLWVLHAWVWQPNPDGIFTDWNPRITCPAS
jgi:hypothetical protein